MNRTSRLLSCVFLASLVPACVADSSTDSADDGAQRADDADTSSIAWRASSVAALDQATGQGTTLSVATPTGTASGDVEIAAVAVSGEVSVSAPSGWTLVDKRVDASSTVGTKHGVATFVFSHAAGAVEPANVGFSFSAKTRGVATIQSYTNVDVAAPVDAVGSLAETTTRADHTTPAITTTAAGDVLIGVFATVSPKEPATLTSTMSHARVNRSSGNTDSWGIDLALFESAPRTQAEKESGRAATGTSATDGATMTLLALKKKASPPVASTLFGAAFNPHTQANLNVLDGAWGGVQIVRSYGKSPSDFASKFLSIDVGAHAASNFSFKLLPKEVTAGQHDAELTAFFAAIPDDHPTYWTYWHEPDDELYKSHTFTPPDYRAAWKYIRGIADRARASRPHLQVFATQIIMEYSMRPNIAPSRPLLGDNGMYAGDDVIEVFGVDAYNDQADKGGEYDPDTQFGKVIAFAQAHKKPWGIGEFGSCPVDGDAQGRKKYITAAIDYWLSKNSVPTFVEWFDVEWPTCDYRIENDAVTSAVWKQATTEGIGSF